MCHTCQLRGKPNQKVKQAPLCPISVVENLFEYLIVDCVGPLPKSKAGSSYLLTVVCKSTRYTTFGIPYVIQTDQGSNFMSCTFTQVLKQLQVKHNVSNSLWLSESQRALERFHQTLKSMLRSYCTRLSHAREEGLPWLLLAVRELLQESTDQISWFLGTLFGAAWQC